MAWHSVVGIALLLGLAVAFAGYAAWWHDPGPNGVLTRYPDGAKWAVIEGVVKQGMPSPPDDPARWEPEAHRELSAGAAIAASIEAEADSDQATSRAPELVEGHGELKPDVAREAEQSLSRLPLVFQQREIAPPSILLACDADLTTGLPLTGTIRVVIDDFPTERIPLRAGDRIRVSGQLKPLVGARNPGEPDLRQRSLDRGIHASMQLKSAAHAVLLEHTDAYPLQQFCESARAWLLELAAAPNSNSTSAQPHPLFAALVLGDGSSLPRETREQFLRSGGIHILVVSGLHIMVMGFGVWLLAAALGLGLRMRALVVAIVAVAFLILTGMGTPALRAATVVVLFSCARIGGRRADFLNVLAVSAIIVLIRSPGDMFTPGFQLSYLCVLVLALFTPKLAWMAPNNRVHGKTLLGAIALWCKQRPRWFAHWLAVSLAGSTIVFLITTPLAQSQWLVVSPIAIPLAVASVPILFLILLAALVLPLASLWDPARELIASTLHTLCALLDDMARIGAETPYGHAWMPPVPAWWVAVFLLLILAIAFFRRLPRPMLWAGIATACWCGTLALIPLQHQAEPEPRIHFLDVAQGACAVLESPGGVMVADCGSQMRPHVGEWTVVPFLLTRGHLAVDVLLLSHVDADHINGAISLCERLEVRELWISPVFEDAPNGEAVLAALEARVGRVRRLEAQTKCRVGAFEIEVFWPHPGFAAMGRSQTTQTNAASLVIRASCPGLSALITGDAEDTATVGMWGELGATDVLQAPHHGSSFDNLGILVGKTTPKHVVVSARETFPSAETLEFLGRDSQVWPTFRYGCVTFVAGASKLGVTLSPSVIKSP